MAAVQPAVRPPDETVQGFVAIVDPPAIQQHLRRPIRFVITVRIRDERQVGWRTDEDPSETDSESRGECQLVGERLLFVEDAITVCILQDLDSADLVTGVITTSSMSGSTRLVKWI